MNLKKIQASLSDGTSYSFYMKLKKVQLFFSDGTSYVTDVNDSQSDESIRNYFLGAELSLTEDISRRCVNVIIDGKSPTFTANCEALIQSIPAQTGDAAHFGVRLVAAVERIKKLEKLVKDMMMEIPQFDYTEDLKKILAEN